MSQKMLIEGLVDGAGFLCGALLGFGLGRLLGLDVFASGYGTRSMLGIVLVGVGGGLGVQAARRWCARKK